MDTPGDHDNSSLCFPFWPRPGHGFVGTEIAWEDRWTTHLGAGRFRKCDGSRSGRMENFDVLNTFQYNPKCQPGSWWSMWLHTNTHTNRSANGSGVGALRSLRSSMSTPRPVKSVVRCYFEGTAVAENKTTRSSWGRRILQRTARAWSRSNQEEKMRRTRECRWCRTASLTLAGRQRKGWKVVKRRQAAFRSGLMPSCRST